jgi:hypothetical protein
MASTPDSTTPPNSADVPPIDKRPEAAALPHNGTELPGAVKEEAKTLTPEEIKKRAAKIAGIRSNISHIAGAVGIPLVTEGALRAGTTVGMAAIPGMQPLVAAQVAIYGGDRLLGHSTKLSRALVYPSKDFIMAAAGEEGAESLLGSPINKLLSKMESWGESASPPWMKKFFNYAESAGKLATLPIKFGFAVEALTMILFDLFDEGKDSLSKRREFKANEAKRKKDEAEAAKKKEEAKNGDKGENDKPSPGEGPNSGGDGSTASETPSDDIEAENILEQLEEGREREVRNQVDFMSRLEGAPTPLPPQVELYSRIFAGDPNLDLLQNYNLYSWLHIDSSRTSDPSAFIEAIDTRRNLNNFLNILTNPQNGEGILVSAEDNGQAIIDLGNVRNFILALLNNQVPNFEGKNAQIAKYLLDIFGIDVNGVTPANLLMLRILADDLRMIINRLGEGNALSSLREDLNNLVNVAQLFGNNEDAVKKYNDAFSAGAADGIFPHSNMRELPLNASQAYLNVQQELLPKIPMAPMGDVFGFLCFAITPTQEDLKTEQQRLKNVQAQLPSTDKIQQDITATVEYFNANNLDLIGTLDRLHNINPAVILNLARTIEDKNVGIDTVQIDAQMVEKVTDEETRQLLQDSIAFSSLIILLGPSFYALYERSINTSPMYYDFMIKGEDGQLNLDLQKVPAVVQKLQDQLQQKVDLIEAITSLSPEEYERLRKARNNELLRPIRTGEGFPNDDLYGKDSRDHLHLIENIRQVLVAVELPFPGLDLEILQINDLIPSEPLANERIVEIANGLEVLANHIIILLGADVEDNLKPDLFEALSLIISFLTPLGFEEDSSGNIKINTNVLKLYLNGVNVYENTLYPAVAFAAPPFGFETGTTVKLDKTLHTNLSSSENSQVESTESIPNPEGYSSFEQMKNDLEVLLDFLKLQLVNNRDNNDLRWAITAMENALRAADPKTGMIVVRIEGFGMFQEGIPIDVFLEQVRHFLNAEDSQATNETELNQILKRLEPFVQNYEDAQLEWREDRRGFREQRISLEAAYVDSDMRKQGNEIQNWKYAEGLMKNRRVIIFTPPDIASPGAEIPAPNLETRIMDNPFREKDYVRDDTRVIDLYSYNLLNVDFIGCPLILTNNIEVEKNIIINFDTPVALTINGRPVRNITNLTYEGPTRGLIAFTADGITYRKHEGKFIPESRETTKRNEPTTPVGSRFDKGDAPMHEQGPAKRFEVEEGEDLTELRNALNRGERIEVKLPEGYTLEIKYSSTEITELKLVPKAVVGNVEQNITVDSKGARAVTRVYDANDPTRSTVTTIDTSNPPQIRTLQIASNISLSVGLDEERVVSSEPAVESNTYYLQIKRKETVEKESSRREAGSADVAIEGDNYDAIIGERRNRITSIDVLGIPMHDYGIAPEAIVDQTPGIVVGRVTLEIESPASVVIDGTRIADVTKLTYNGRTGELIGYVAGGRTYLRNSDASKAA